MEQSFTAPVRPLKIHPNQPAPQESTSIIQQIAGALMSGGASIAVFLGILNQICVISLAGSGWEKAPLEEYFRPSYLFTIVGIALFYIGLVTGMRKMTPQNRKAAILAAVASALFLTAMCLMLSDITLNEGLGKAVKSVYLIIAIKAALLFTGFIFLYNAVSKSALSVNKVWKIIVKITIVVLALFSLLMLLPIAGDIFFGLAYLPAGMIFIVALFHVVKNN